MMKKLILLLLLIPSIVFGVGLDGVKLSGVSSQIAPVFDAPLTHSLILDGGAVGPTFTRATTKSGVDFELATHTGLINESIFTGARRVENLCTDSEVYATETITVFSGIDYIFSFTGTGSVTFSGAATGTLAGTGANDRVQVTKTTGSTSLTITVTGSVLKAQLEKVSGTQTVASEYVSSGVLSDPWHGTGVDGVKYYNTDRAGALIPAATLLGYRTDKESTNLVLQSENQSSAVWLNTWGGGVTLTPDAIISPDGTKTADEIAQIDGTDNSSNQLIILSASTMYTQSCYFKNNSSTRSSFRIHDQNAAATLAIIRFDWTGTTPSTKSSTGASNIKYEELYDDWWRISFSYTTAATVTSHQYVISPEALAVTTNSVYVWGAMINLGKFPTAYIKTTTAQVTRTPDELCYANTNNQLLPNSFSLIMSTTPAADGEDYETNAVRLFSTDDTAGTNDEMRIANGVSYGYTSTGGGGFFNILETDLGIDTQGKYGFQLYQDGSDSDAKIFLNGTKKHEETNTQTLAHSDTSICLGFFNTFYYTGNIKDVSIFKNKLSDSEMAWRTQ